MQRLDRARRLSRRPVVCVSKMVGRWQGRRLTSRRRRVERIVYEATHGCVSSGPFRGMRFVPRSVWGPSTPMLLGTYEAELHTAIERLVARRPTRVLDVGAADGYYAVGLALRLPEATVYAYDVDADARRRCSDVARKNGVGARVEVRERCTHTELRRLAGSGCLLLVDCEGCEAELLDPICVPELTTTAMLVELHDFIDPTISSRVVERFSRTHRVELIDATTRDRSHVAVLASLHRRDRADAVDERRPTRPHPMQWVVLSPLAEAGEELGV